MTRRLIAIVLASAVLLGGVAGCQRTVQVQTGERVVCRYGDVIKDTVHTIRVPASKAAEYGIKSSFGICERHSRLLDLYSRAQSELATGTVAAAKSLLQRVVASDPKFERASQQLASIAAGRRPKPDTTVRQPTGGSTAGGSTGTTKPPSGDTPVGPTLALAAWAPPKLDGFTTASTAADPLALSRDYIPDNRKSLEALVIAVEQFANGKMASASLKTQMSHYGKNVRSEKIAGRTCTFGTDGRQFAALGFVDGAMLIILEGHAQKGVEPATLHDRIVDVASTLPVK